MLTVTTKPGDKYRSIKRPKVYEALRRRGYSKARAAAISNAQAKHKAYTLDQLERYVCSPCYDPRIAQAIADHIPEIPRLKGEQIAPGITRIRGNLCNVHGKYGPCDKAQAGGKKPKGARKPRKAPKTPEQRTEERQAQQAKNRDAVKQRMAESDTGLSPGGVDALVDFAGGKQPNKQTGDGLVQMGLAEQATDGSYRMTPTGRAAVSAMNAGDYQRAVDAISRGTDTATRRRDSATARQQRQETAAANRATRQMDRQLRERERNAKRAQQQAERQRRQRAAGGGKKKPAEPGAERPRSTAQAAPRSRVGGTSPVGGATGSSAPKKPEKPKPEKTTPKLAPKLQDAVQRLSDGAELSDAEIDQLVTNGLVKINKDGEPILTAAGQRATKKSASITVFKDARGAWRWVAYSSTAYQDRDRETVSTKALADDVARADTDRFYGPLRWWHQPGLDLGDCDFNALHGRILIESGTFRSEPIARKVAQHAADLEVSLGFVHPPHEPDRDGVFHTIRRFERSLVPRGKASNLFTGFQVKGAEPMDQAKIEGLKAVGFSDGDIADIIARADAKMKTADDVGTAFKADEPQQEITIGGVTYVLTEKAPPPPEAPVPDEPEMVVEEDALPMEEEESAGGLTLSPEDLSAIAQAVGAAVGEQFQSALAQIMGGLDLEKKVASHVQGLLQPYQATKDAADAEKAEQIAALKTSLEAQQASLAETQARLAELIGDAPAVAPYRASQAADSILGPDAALLATVKNQQTGGGPFDDIVGNLFGNGVLQR